MVGILNILYRSLCETELFQNQFRGDNSNETRLLMGAPVKLLLAVPISLAGVLTYTEMLSLMFSSNMLLPRPARNIPGIFVECSLSVAMFGTSREHLGNILKEKIF